MSSSGAGVIKGQLKLKGDSGPLLGAKKKKKEKKNKNADVDAPIPSTNNIVDAASSAAASSGAAASSSAPGPSSSPVPRLGDMMGSTKPVSSWETETAAPAQGVGAQTSGAAGRPIFRY